MSQLGDIVVTTVDDALFRDEQALVLVGSAVMLLSPVTSEIVSQCVEGVSLGELSALLEAKFGPPPEGQTADFQTDMLVQELAEAGVVTVTAVGSSADVSS